MGTYPPCWVFKVQGAEYYFISFIFMLSVILNISLIVVNKIFLIARCESWQLCILLLIIFLIDVKFASGIKNINFGFHPYTDVC